MKIDITLDDATTEVNESYWSRRRKQDLYYLENRMHSESIDDIFSKRNYAQNCANGGTSRALSMYLAGYTLEAKHLAGKMMEIIYRVIAEKRFTHIYHPFRLPFEEDEDYETLWREHEYKRSLLTQCQLSTEAAKGQYVCLHMLAKLSWIRDDLYPMVIFNEICEARNTYDAVVELELYRDNAFSYCTELLMAHREADVVSYIANWRLSSGYHTDNVEYSNGLELDAIEAFAMYKSGNCSSAADATRIANHWY